MHNAEAARSEGRYTPRGAAVWPTILMGLVLIGRASSLVVWLQLDRTPATGDQVAYHRMSRTYAEPLSDPGTVTLPRLLGVRGFHPPGLPLSGAVAATVLSEEGHAGKTYTLTGPEALTPPQMVHTIGAAIGRDLQFVELTEAQARARWRASGYPDEAIEFFVFVQRDTPPVGYTVVPTVERVTGRPARTFAQWAAEHAGAFRG